MNYNYLMTLSSALHLWLTEWGTRIAVPNSNLDNVDEDPNMPMPKWDGAYYRAWPYGVSGG
ncbi:hypothetical protein [Mucilaginibacter humi]|uniref:hypothetical protein n=1 Tax=Mucilaginibacter humi TaxID=2732510 RepID=UPI001C2EE350|nr:hypothetical protein [Mucilaginibacter humi]